SSETACRLLSWWIRRAYSGGTVTVLVACPSWPVTPAGMDEGTDIAASAGVYETLESLGLDRRVGRVRGVLLPRSACAPYQSMCRQISRAAQIGAPTLPRGFKSPSAVSYVCEPYGGEP